MLHNEYDLKFFEKGKSGVDEVRTWVYIKNVMRKENLNGILLFDIFFVEIGVNDSKINI